MQLTSLTAPAAISGGSLRRRRRSRPTCRRSRPAAPPRCACRPAARDRPRDPGAARDRQDPRALLDALLDDILADEIDRPFERAAIDDDLDEVAVAQLADRAAGQRFGRDVADARAGRHAAEPRVGDDRDVLAERQVPQRAGELIGLLHAGAHRPAARSARARRRPRSASP